MSTALKNTLEKYLRDHHVITLATAGAQGPWASAVFYVADGLDLIFLSAPHTRHAKNFGAGVAGAIHDNLENWEELKGVQLEGQCEMLEGAQRARAIDIYQTRFPITGPDAPAPIAAALDKVNFYRLKATSLSFIDNSQKLGHRETLDIA